MKLEFEVCHDCLVKSGSQDPDLCSDCLRNRDIITELTRQLCIEKLRADDEEKQRRVNYEDALAKEDELIKVRNQRDEAAEERDRLRETVCKNVDKNLRLIEERDKKYRDFKEIIRASIPCIQFCITHLIDIYGPGENISQKLFLQGWPLPVGPIRQIHKGALLQAAEEAVKQ